MKEQKKWIMEMRKDPSVTEVNKEGISKSPRETRYSEWKRERGDGMAEETEGMIRYQELRIERGLRRRGGVNRQT